MSHETSRLMEIEEPNCPDSPESWVHEVLEPDQLTGSKIPYGRRKLGRGTLALLWVLRLYVVFMVFIVCLAVWNALHPAN